MVLRFISPSSGFVISLCESVVLRSIIASAGRSGPVYNYYNARLQASKDDYFLCMTNVQNLNIPKYNSITHLAPPGAYTSSMVKL